MLNIKRMWINQPSTIQPFHELHGQNVLAVTEPECDKIFRIYFLSGPVVSQRIHSSALSKGWIK